MAGASGAFAPVLQNKLIHFGVLHLGNLRVFLAHLWTLPSLGLGGVGGVRGIGRLGGTGDTGGPGGTLWFALLLLAPQAQGRSRVPGRAAPVQWWGGAVPPTHGEVAGGNTKRVLRNNNHAQSAISSQAARYGSAFPAMSAARDEAQSCKRLPSRGFGETSGLYTAAGWGDTGGPLQGWRWP